MRSAIILIHCPDSKGIVASVTKFVYKYKGNIVYLDQHVDNVHNNFFMRLEVELEGFTTTLKEFKAEFGKTLAKRFSMNWYMHLKDKELRMAVFVSKMPHCLHDILSRYESGEWKVAIPLILSNHPDLNEVAKRHGIEYQHIPVTKENKKEVETKQIELLKKHKIDVVVLARYMQILSEDFIKKYDQKIINIHHSFLPAFPGAKPYHSAYERGVKIIGATSHYVTSDLDAGPIIEQEVVRVNHTDTISDFIRKGRDLEKIVLSRAIRSHLRHKLLVFNNRTVVFA